VQITFDEDEDCGDDVALTQAAVVSENVYTLNPCCAVYAGHSLLDSTD
jgi:hypothetical protein